MQVRQSGAFGNGHGPTRVPTPTVPRREGSHHNMNQLNARLNRFQPIALLILRVSLGVVFVAHGIDKFRAGLGMVEGAFAGWDVPAAGITAPLTAGLEVVAGIALIIGLGTRIAAGLLGLVMIGALFFVKAELGIISTTPMPGAELDLALLVGLVVLFIGGPGAAAADGAIGVESREAVRARTTN